MGDPLLLTALGVVLVVGAARTFGGASGSLAGAAIASLAVSAWFIVRLRVLGERADAIPLIYAVAPAAILVLAAPS